VEQDFRPKYSDLMGHTFGQALAFTFFKSMSYAEM